MRRLIPILISLGLALAAHAQDDGLLGYAYLPAPSLPTTWVNNNEGNSAWTYELSFPSSWVGSAPPGCTFHLPYSVNLAGLQSSIDDIEACRTLTGFGIAEDIPPGLYTSANGLVIPQSNTALSLNFIVLRSTDDASLPNGQTVCAHGIQDNLATSGDIGLDNPDCAGDAMYYRLGTTTTNISAGALTLANGIVTNTAAYNDVQYMWTAECSGTNCAAMNFCSPLGASSTSIPAKCASATIAPDHWLIEDMEARMSAGNTGNQNVVSVQMTQSETSTSEFSTHIHFRKIWQHGDWTTLIAGRNSISSGMELDCIYCSVVDSQFSQDLRPGSEGHIITAQGEGPYKFDHNWMEGQSSSIFSGGLQALTALPIAGYVPFQDVEIRRNRLTFPYAWLGVLTIPSGNTFWTGNGIARKNALETKNWARLLEDGNVIENVDNSGGQSGVLSDWNVRQFRVNYQNTGQDATVTNNVFRNSCEGIEIDNSGTNQGDGGGVAFNPRRFLLGNNLMYDISASNPGCSGVEGQNLETGNAGWMWQGTLAGNGTTATFTPDCSVNGGTLGTNGGDCPGQISGYAITSAGTGCVAGALTISPPPAGGMQAAGTYACSSGALSSVTFTNIGSLYVTAPTVTIATGTGTLTVSLYTSASGGLLAGSQVMDFSVGDPIAVFGCTSVTAFNASLTNYSTGSYYWPNAIGPKATAANNTIGSTSVSFPSTVSGTDSAGYCTVITTQGGPQNFYATHNTVISDSAYLPTSDNAATQGPNFAMNWLTRNNIWVSGIGGGTLGWDSNRGEGTPTEKFNYDVTSMTADHEVRPGRTASNYTEYSNNSPFNKGLCAIATGCSPPLSMYFPTTPYCTGATSTSACVGFVGAMSASSMPLALADYHGYSLRSDSVFYTGAVSQASDGSSMGVNLAAIDAAQTQNVYQCNTPTPCNGTGPYPDNPPESLISSCPLTVPLGVTNCYFFDYINGSDTNAGNSETAPWQHMPGSANVTGIAAAHVPGNGEGWIFKGGVRVDYHAWPAAIPWGSTSSATPDYIGYDSGWYAGASWTRPIFDGGSGSLNADAIGGSLITDATHHASYFVLDNIEFTGFYWSSSTHCFVQSGTCGYVSSSMSLTQSYDVGWEFKNLYAHNITHAPGSSTVGDQAPYGLFWMPRDAASSWHDGVIDNTDGSNDCCGAVFAANIYNAYFSGLDNVIYDPSAPSQQPTNFIVHDFVIANMTNTFQTGVVSGNSPPHGNCIHLFGNNPSSYYEFIYNGRIDCASVNAETLEMEEDFATLYAFNLVVTNEYQPNGFDTSSFTGADKGGTYYYFHITEECGIDATPGGPCSHLRNQPSVFHYNNFGIASNSSGGPAIYAPSGWTGSFTSAPNTSKTCDGITTANFGGILICAPIGVNNGTGNLNISETCAGVICPFAPLDSTAAATVGTSSGVPSLCSTIAGINAAVGAACLNDTTLGVTYNTGNHTVSWPARTPLVRSLVAPENGAYEF